MIVYLWLLLLAGLFCRCSGDWFCGGMMCVWFVVVCGCVIGGVVLLVIVCCLWVDLLRCLLCGYCCFVGLLIMLF